MSSVIYVVMEAQADWHWNGVYSEEVDEQVPVRAFLTKDEAKSYMARHDSNQMHVEEVPLGDE